MKKKVTKKKESPRAEYQRQYRKENAKQYNDYQREYQREYQRQRRAGTLHAKPKMVKQSYMITVDKRVHFPRPEGYTIDELLALIPTIKDALESHSQLQYLLKKKASPRPPRSRNERGKRTPK